MSETSEHLPQAISPDKQQDFIFYAKAPRYNWEKDSACAGLDPDIFLETSHVGRYHNNPDDDNDPNAIALNHCATCVVRLECLTTALETPREGIWGGMIGKERTTLARNIGRHGLRLKLPAEAVQALGRPLPYVEQEYKEVLYHELQTHTVKREVNKDNPTAKPFAETFKQFVEGLNGSIEFKELNMYDYLRERFDVSKNTIWKTISVLEDTGEIRLQRGLRRRIDRIELCVIDTERDLPETA